MELHARIVQTLSSLKNKQNISNHYNIIFSKKKKNENNENN